MLVIIFIMQAITFFVIINNMPDDAQAKQRIAEEKRLFNHYYSLTYLLDLLSLGEKRLENKIADELKVVALELLKFGYTVPHTPYQVTKKPCKKKK